MCGPWMTRCYSTPELGYRYNYRIHITWQVVFCIPAPKISSLFSIAHFHIYSQYLTVALMAFQRLKMEHFTTVPQHLALWLLLIALITLHCLENLKEPVSLLAGPTQTQLVVRNGWSVVQFVSEVCHCWEVKGDWHHCAQSLEAG